MEALTDGIFAIAMTLLVLELKVPDLPKSANATELLHKIGEEMPALFSFMISFLYCGLLWVMHHLAMHFVRHLQIGLVWLNMLFLMSISTMPFSCGLLGHFLRNRAAQEIYFANMFVAAALLAAQWLVARKKKLINEDDPQSQRLDGTTAHVFSRGFGCGYGGRLTSTLLPVHTPSSSCCWHCACGSEDGTARMPLIPSALLPDLNIEPLDLLVQRGKRNVEALGGFGLVPVAFFQHVDDHAALAVFNDVEQ